MPICRGAYGLVYNTAGLKRPPSSWQVFWAPEYKGQHNLGAREYLYNVCTAALAAGIPGEDIARFDVLNTPPFRQRLRLLARNAGGFRIGQDKAADLAGKAFSMGWGDSLNVLRKRGEHWRFASRKEGVICWVDAYALTRALEGRPFLKKVAEAWVNFLLAPDFQAGCKVREISQKPVTTTVVPHLTPDKKNGFIWMWQPPRPKPVSCCPPATPGTGTGLNYCGMKPWKGSDETGHPEIHRIQTAPHPGHRRGRNFDGWKSYSTTWFKTWTRPWKSAGRAGRGEFTTNIVCI